MAQANKDTPRSTFDQSDIETEIGFYKTLFRLTDAARESCLPAIVVEDENEDGLIKVQPLVNSMKQMAGGLQGFKKSPILVRKYKLFHGGFFVSMPVYKGDTGYILAVDRDSTTALKKNKSVLEEAQSGDNGANEGPQDPDSFEYQKYIHGFFLPCSWYDDQDDDVKDLLGEGGYFKDKFVVSNFHKDKGKDASISIDREGNIEAETNGAIVNINPEGVKVSAFDGEDETVTIEIGKDGTVSIKCKKAEVTAEESASVKSESFEIESPKINLRGEVSVFGDTKMNGRADVAGDANIGGISFLQHKHISSVEGSPTSPPS